MATIADFISPVTKLLGNRSDVPGLAVQEIADTIIELSNDYPFEELRENGPLVALTPGVNQYALSAFLALAVDSAPQHVLNKVISWFYYLYPPTPLSSYPVGASNSNSGYNLQFRDIEDLEVLINVLTVPIFWSWFGENLYIAGTPNNTNPIYLRYSFLHPFTSPVALNSDPVLLPQNWWDIIQYGAAERIALQLRMSDVADRYHQKLYGDPEFQRSSGGRGQPGLIHRRISQTQKNQARSVRSVKMMRGGY